MNGNWRTTLGGAVVALGVTLFGAPIALSVCGVDLPKSLLQAMVVSGFIIQAVGAFLSHLFSADAKQVSCLAQQVSDNSDAVQQLRGDTAVLVKSANGNIITQTQNTVPSATDKLAD